MNVANTGIHRGRRRYGKHTARIGTVFNDLEYAMNKKVTIEIASNINLSAINSVPNDPVNRTEMISISAYFRAEKSGFSSSDEISNWLVSEAEIDSHLNSFSS